jgi:hypothetical protein
MRGSDWQDMGESCTQKAVLLAIGWTGGGSLSTCGGECADLKIFRRDVRIVCSCAARGVCCIMLTAVDRLNCRCGFDGAPLLGGGFNLRRVLAPGLRSPFVTTSFSLFPRSTQKKVGRKKAGYLAPVLFDWIYQQIYLASRRGKLVARKLVARKSSWSPRTIGTGPGTPAARASEPRRDS